MARKHPEEERMAREFRAALIKRQETAPRGWQKQLADITGLREAAISKIVNGTRTATVRQMLAIAGALKDPSLVPGGLAELAKSGRAPEQQPGDLNEVSGPGSTLASTPIPASLQAFFDAHPDLDPAVRWELEQNHDQRMPPWKKQDEPFWIRLANFWAGELGLPGPFAKRRASSERAARKSGG